MNNNDKIFEDYYSGRLPAEGSNAFTKILEKDENLKIEYELFLALKKSVSEIQRDKMRTKLAEIELITKKTKAKPKTTILTLAKWSVGIAAFFLISFWTFNTLNPNGSQELYSQNFQTYKVQAERGGATDALKQLYKEKKYNIFIAEATKEDETPELNMMLANAYLNVDKYSDAIEILNKISDDSSLRDQKYWYLGLTNLKQNNLEQARKNFRKLLSLSNYKKAEIEKILFSIGGK